MRSNLILIFALIISVSCTAQKTSKKNLNAKEFSEQVNQNPEALVLDVRTPEEFAKGHLPAARNINWNASDFEKQITSIDKKQPVYVYCLSGGRSGEAAAKMRNLGYEKVIELDGGILKWREAKLPETAPKTALSAGMSRQDFEHLLKTDQIVLVDFYADWCAPCKKMKPSLEQISTEMAGKVKVIRINQDENPALAKELNITVLPTVQIYKNNSITWKKEGFVSKEEMVNNLK